MKKALLAGTALVGATALAGGAHADMMVGDNMSVNLSGNLRVSYLIFDQDREHGRERGYQFRSDESEIAFAASATADSGMKYGFTVELQSQTNDDGGNSDETWMFIDGGDSWGRIEMGDQDGAADRMFVGGEDSMPGRGGYDGAVGDVFNFSRRSAFNGPGFDTTGDATKIIYFSPRFGGLQLGASYTPDNGQNGSSGIDDLGGDREDIISLGANYRMATEDLEVTIGAAVEFGDHEMVDGFRGTEEIDDLVVETTPHDDGSGFVHTHQETVIQGSTYDDDWQRWGFGGKLSFAGFEVSSGYVTQSDFRVERGAVNDAGERVGKSSGDDWWANIGIRYTTGPWKIGGGYFYSETEHEVVGPNTDDTEVKIFSIGANYNVAPGFDIATDINFVDEETYDLTPDVADDNLDNDGTVFVLSTIMSF